MTPTGTLTLLHVTDTHLADAGTALNRDDHKVTVAGLAPQTRELALEQCLRRLGERLVKEGTSLDGVIFSGDAQDRGREGGHKMLFDLFIHHFRAVGIVPSNIVSVPGNHDVDRRYDPSTPMRYQAFMDVWRANGCVVPWLDGVDKEDLENPPSTHRLAAENGDWAIFPINSSNWCHSAAVLPTPLKEIWNQLPTLGAGGDETIEKKLRGQLDALARYDMARVSDSQLEQLRKSVDTVPMPTHGHQLRIAVLHHHLRTPNLREELKPFADISNVEQIRAFLRDRRIDVVIHGHKHAHAAQIEYLHDYAGNIERPVLVISGSTFEEGRETDALRLIRVRGLPYTPSIEIEPIGLPRGGVDAAPANVVVKKLWSSSPLPGGPIVLQGSDIDEIYDRATYAAENEAANSTLIVHLDLPPSQSNHLPLPRNYPTVETLQGDARQKWLRELVEWWQLDRSNLEHRMPFLHGIRLRRYGGKIDQIDRIKKLLAIKATTRALAVLLDPFSDFTSDGQNEEFASFSLVEFKRRDLAPGKYAIDAIAFYRAQEFARWWPINIAELRFLQVEICQYLNFTPGRITTIAADARTHSRSPTQVAMPIIDRWLDQSPHRIHVLANVIVSGISQNNADREAVSGWHKCLNELEAVTSNFNPDGVPIPIEGLQILASYLDVTGDPALEAFVRALQRTAIDNKNFENSKRDRPAFDDWAVRTVDMIAELRRLTEARIPAEA